MQHAKLLTSCLVFALGCSNEDGKASAPGQSNGGSIGTSSAATTSGGNNNTASSTLGGSGATNNSTLSSGGSLTPSAGGASTTSVGNLGGNPTSSITSTNNGGNMGGASAGSSSGVSIGGRTNSAPTTSAAGKSSGGASATATGKSGGTSNSTAPAAGRGGAVTAGGTAPGGSSNPPSSVGCGADCKSEVVGTCSTPQVRITPVSLGAALSFDTSETGVLPLVIAAKPNGGSRIAWMTGYGTNASSATGLMHVADLDCADKLVGTPFTVAAHDFQDLAADATGGAMLLTRDAQGGGTLNCGEPTSLCGTPPSPAVACYDMYMVRHDCSGKELWATKLTSSSATQVPYSAGSGSNYMVWWYQHQGRLAFDGTNYAAYFCDGIVVKNGTCVDIHQGDRMKVVDASGATLTGHDSFDLGCSHSGFTRIIWDATVSKFVMVCKTDNSNRIAQPNPYRTVMPVTLDGSYLGDLVPAKSGGYWLTASNSGALHLLHFNNGAQADQDKNLGTGNYPHLVRYGSNQMLAVWSSTATGNMTAQVFDTDGTEISAPFAIGAPNHPYQSFKAYPDGSAAFATVASSSATVQIVRILPCGA